MKYWPVTVSVIAPWRYASMGLGSIPDIVPVFALGFQSVLKGSDCVFHAGRVCHV